MLTKNRCFLLPLLRAVAVAGLIFSTLTPCRANEAPVLRCVHQSTDSTADLTINGLKQPLRILQITDVHISVIDSSEKKYHAFSRRMDNAFITREHYRTKEPAAALPRFLGLLHKAKQEKVDLIVLTGDIVNNPSRSSVAFVTRAIKECGIPALYIPGNHDWHYEGMEGSSEKLRQTWTKKSLKPLYGDHSLMAYAVDCKGVRIIAIDNSTYQVNEKQLAFFKREAGRGGPVVLLSHIPYYIPGSERAFGCGNPNWGWDQDRGFETERRQRWPKSGNSRSTVEFVELLGHTPNLVAVLAGHIHHNVSQKIADHAWQYSTAAAFAGASRLITIKPEWQGVMLNYDCTDMFFNSPPDQISGEVIDGQVDRVAEAGVSIFMCNTNAQRTNYASQAFEPFWSGYDPNGPDEQPFLLDMAPESRKNYRSMVESMMVLSRQGVDYPARVIQRCRFHGISPWISLRMNDIHNNDEPDHPIHSTFWKNHHECWRVPDRRIDYYDRALDYSHESVRQRYLGLIRETLERYDMDGLELDFMREPYLFKPGHEAEGSRILCEWLKQVRELVVQTAARRGHGIKIGVRVPANPITAKNLGLDAVEWARLGLIDLVVVTPRWASMDTDLPLAVWKDLLSPWPVTLAGGIEIREQAFPDGPARLTDSATAVAAAATILSRGADAVYLFNYFPSLIKNGWTPEAYKNTLSAMTSAATMAGMTRRHMLTFRDVFAPGEARDNALPVTARRPSFRLGTAARPQGQAVTAMVRLRPQDDALAPELWINGIRCPLLSQVQNEYTFTVPEQAMMEQVQVVEVADKGGLSITVEHVEITIAAAPIQQRVKR